MGLKVAMDIARTRCHWSQNEKGVFPSGIFTVWSESRLAPVDGELAAHAWICLHSTLWEFWAQLLSSAQNTDRGVEIAVHAWWALHSLSLDHTPDGNTPLNLAISCIQNCCVLSSLSAWILYSYNLLSTGRAFSVNKVTIYCRLCSAYLRLHWCPWGSNWSITQFLATKDYEVT